MKILIVKTSSLGDIVQTYPVLSYLRMRYPQAQIDWIVEKPFSDLVRSHPYINHTMTINTKEWRRRKDRLGYQLFLEELLQETYDVLFDIQGNAKSGFFTWKANAKDKVGFGWKTVPEWVNLLVTNKKFNPSKGQNRRQDYLDLVKMYFEDQESYTDPGIMLTLSAEQKSGMDAILSSICHLQKPHLMVCPGSMWWNKQLSKNQLLGFLEKIREGSFLFIYGNEQELKAVQELQAAFPKRSMVLEKMTLPILQNLMCHMDQVISMDSLPLHLAGTTPTPTFSIFGASSSKKYMPIGSRHQSFQGVCPYLIRFERRCPFLRICPTGRCIHDIDPKILHDSYLQKHL